MPNLMDRLLKKASPTARVFVYSTIMAMAAMVFGFDTGTLGAITQMPEFEKQFGVLGEGIRGIVVAIILVPSAVTGIMGGSIADRISRKYTVSLGAAIFAAGCAIATGSNSMGLLIFARCLAGVGEGLFLGVMGVYITEISPAHIRGRTMLMATLLNTAAIAAGFFICYGSTKINSSLSWRLPFALNTLASAALAVLAPMCPYSPRWLMSQGRRDEAAAVLEWLAGDANEAEKRELLAVPPRVESKRAAFLDIWKKDVRGRTTLGVLLNGFTQLSGIDFVLFWAPLLFTYAGLSASSASFVASGCTGLVLFAATLISTTFVDKVGRRTLWLIGGAGLGSCQLLLGVMYASGAAHQRVGKWVVVVVIELFAFCFSSTWSIMIRVYSAEVQPSRTRAAASAFGQGMNQLLNFAVAVSGPAFLAASSSAPYFVYGALCMLGLAYGYVLVPETRGHSLESIEVAFEKSHYAVEWPRNLLGRTRRGGTLRQRRASRPSFGAGEAERRSVRPPSSVMELDEVGGGEPEDKRDGQESAVVGGG